MLLCQKKVVILHPKTRETKSLFEAKREYSSVGSEHLPYKQRVIGSNPITPTKTSKPLTCWFFFMTVQTHLIIQVKISDV